MIECTKHGTRYEMLMQRVTTRAHDGRRRDSGYMSALFILSADPELTALAQPYMTHEGISFASIRQSAQRAGLSGSQICAVETAYSLFRGEGAVSLVQIAQCQLDELDILACAPYVWKGVREPVVQSSGELYLDNTKEKRQRKFDKAFGLLFDDGLRGSVTEWETPEL